MKRRDVLFGAGVILFVTACFILRGLLYHGDAVYLDFSQNGSLIRRVSLTESEGQDIRINSADGGYNLVHIENGSVFVRESDCENGDCIRQGAIRRTGESIICLPHKLVITIVSDLNGINDEDTDTERYDTIVR